MKIPRGDKKGGGEKEKVGEVVNADTGDTDNATKWVQCV